MMPICTNSSWLRYSSCSFLLKFFSWYSSRIAVILVYLHWILHLKCWVSCVKFKVTPYFKRKLSKSPSPVVTRWFRTCFLFKKYWIISFFRSFSCKFQFTTWNWRTLFNVPIFGLTFEQKVLDNPANQDNLQRCFVEDSVACWTNYFSQGGAITECMGSNFPQRLLQVNSFEITALFKGIFFDFW